MDATTIATSTAPMPKERAAGIYFGLPEEPYRTDIGAGSTDMKKLRFNPPSYWYDSYMNPRRPVEKTTPARIRGSAMHKIVLEGEAAFDALYMAGPQHTEDMSPSEKGAATKAANQKAAMLGKTCLPREDYDRVVIAKSMIMLNPDLKTAFQNGIPEVSIIWERGGLRRKARIDYLKPRGIGDLKGCANTRDIAFDAACRNDIANYNYHIQVAHYYEARALIPQFVADGAVYGDCDPTLLKAISAQKQYGWQWVFFQTEGAPITWDYTLSPGNPIIDTAKRDLEIACARYRRYLDKYGTDIWLAETQRESHELDFDAMPPWFARTTNEELDEYDAWMRAKGAQ